MGTENQALLSNRGGFTVVRFGEHTIRFRMAIDSGGNMMMRMSDNMAMDMDSGELHFVSSWDNDEDDD